MSSIENKIELFLNQNIDRIIADINSIVKIKTYATKKQEKIIHSKNIHKAFSCLKKICLRDNINFFENNDYFVIGKKKSNKILILHHMDTVQIYDKEKWKTNPFAAIKIKDEIFGRGINDNKGPLIFSYYILQFLKQINPNIFENISIFVGSAEETDWKGISKYKLDNKIPKYAISPDGNYPLVNIERGKLFLEISQNIKNDNKIIIDSPKIENYVISEISVNNKKWRSPVEKSRNAYKIGDNHVIKKIINDSEINFSAEIKWIEKYLTNGLIKNSIKKNNKDDKETIAITHLSLKNKKILCTIDIRYSIIETRKNILNFFRINNWNIKIIKDIKKHHVKDQFFIKTLMDSYNNVINDNLKPLIFSGISYARAFENAIVFGTTMPNEIVNSHSYNEKININNMIKSSKILLRALIDLNK